MSKFNWNEIPKKYNHRYYYPDGEQAILSHLPILALECSPSCKHEQRPPELVDGGLYVMDGKIGYKWIGRYIESNDSFHLPPFNGDCMLAQDVTVIKRLPDDLLEDEND